MNGEEAWVNRGRRWAAEHAPILMVYGILFASLAVLIALNLLRG